MGKAKNGILGALTGKVNNLVYYQNGGQNIVRVLGTRKTPITKAERLNMGKMTLLMEVFKNIKPFLKAGFGVAAQGTKLNYHNVATSINRRSLQNLNGNLQGLDYEHLVLSAGDAEPVEAPKVEAAPTGLRYSWDWNPDDYNTGEDQAMMMAYLPDQNAAIYEIAGAKRKQLEDIVFMPPSYLQERLELFIAFITNDRTKVSNSMYLGRIN